MLNETRPYDICDIGIFVESTCRDGYVLNPFSSTCIRFVQQTGNWSQAKSACEEAGETLAVFPTEASARWVVSTLKDLQNTPGTLF